MEPEYLLPHYFHCVYGLPYKLYTHYDDESYPIGLNINITDNKAVTAALQTSEVEDLYFDISC